MYRKFYARISRINLNEESRYIELLNYPQNSLQSPQFALRHSKEFCY